MLLYLKTTSTVTSDWKLTETVCFGPSYTSTQSLNVSQVWWHKGVTHAAFKIARFIDHAPFFFARAVWNVTNWSTQKFPSKWTCAVFSVPVGNHFVDSRRFDSEKDCRKSAFSFISFRYRGDSPSTAWISFHQTALCIVNQAPEAETTSRPCAEMEWS